MGVFLAKMEVPFLRDIEAQLGSSTDVQNIFSFQQALARDETEEFPARPLEQLHSMNAFKHLVPHSLGGLSSSSIPLLDPQTFGLLRLLSRRDLTVAVSLGVCGIGSNSVFLFGTSEQQSWASQLLLAGKFFGFALTEVNSGTDILNSQCTATRKDNGGGWNVSGAKWLINFGIKGSAFTLFARTGNEVNMGSFSLILLKSELDGFSTLPKERLLGVKGMDISGFRMDHVAVNDCDIIGKLGDGLTLAMLSLYVTRFACTAFSLGGADTGLREAMRFALNREIYYATVWDIPHARRTLVNAFLDIILCEMGSLAFMELFKSHPGLASVVSAVAKYEIPARLLNAMQSLAPILGARFFLRSGPFQKILRDLMVVPLFDGSTAANLDLISSLLPQLTKPSNSALPVHGSTFQSGKKLDVRQFKLLPSAADGTCLLSNLLHMADQVQGEPYVALFAHLGKARLETMRATIVKTRPAQRSAELFSLAQDFAGLFTGSALLVYWIENRASYSSDSALARSFWVGPMIRRIFGHVEFPSDAHIVEDDKAIEQMLESRTQLNLLYSLFEVPLQ